MPLIKRATPFLFIGASAVTAMLLIMVKRTAIFSLELQNTWVFLNLLENG